MSLRKYVPVKTRKEALHIRFLKNFFYFKRDIKKFCFFKILIPVQYHWAARKPIQPDKVIFLEISSDHLTNSDSVLLNRLISDYNLDVHVHFLQQGQVDKDELYRRQQAFLRDAATAHYLVYNDSYNFTGALKKRKGMHILNLWHGAGAFKKFGFSIADKKFGMDAREMRKFPLHPRYDLVTVSSPEVKWAYVEAMGKEKDPEEVQATGISRTDIFYDPEFVERAKKHLQEVFPAVQNRKVILYAPTFRGHVKDAQSPDLLNIRMFREQLGQDYALVINHHPFVKKAPMVPDDCRDFAMNVTGLLSIDELIAATDVCISDYSSMIFEYSLYEKPMLFYAYDLASYFDWRGFYYDYEELTPGPVCCTNREMIHYISHLDQLFQKEKVHAFREKFMSSCDGHATDRIIDRFFGAGIEPYRRKEALPGDYSMVPDADKPYGAYLSLMHFLEKTRKKFRPVYEKYAESPVVPGRVALVLDEYTDASFFHVFRKKAGKTEGIEVLDDFSKTDLTLQEYAEQLAGAEWILAAGEPYILRMIQVRPETKVIQMMPEMVSPFRKWRNAKEEKIAYYRYDHEHFPIHSEYDGILSTVSEDFSLLRADQNYPLKKGGQILPFGNLYSDLLKDARYHKNSLRQLEALMPETKGKKKILILPKKRPDLGRILTDLLEQIYEDLADSSLCIVKTSDPELIPEYMQGFAISPELKRQRNLEELSEGEEEVEEDDPRIRSISDAALLSTADLVIGDYDLRVLAALAAGKRVLFYNPDLDGYMERSEAYTDIRNLFSSLISETPRELIQKMDMSDAAYTDATAGIRANLLQNCDGKTGERLLDWILKEESEQPVEEHV